MSRRYVLSVFCVADEFQTICKNISATYSGIALTAAADRYPEGLKFVIRFYRTCLGRNADEMDWNTTSQTGQQEADGSEHGESSPAMSSRP